MTAHNPFKYFKTSPKIICLTVMYYVRYPLSFRQVEDILHERGIDICHETVRFWVDRFGPKFAKEIPKKRVGQHSNWQWHLGEVLVKIDGERFYLWRAVDHEVEVLEYYVTRRRNKTAATLQRFVSYHSQIYNHFNHERHLENKQTYKQNAVLLSWSGLKSALHRFE
jgi:putative transposase